MEEIRKEEKKMKKKSIEELEREAWEFIRKLQHKPSSEEWLDAILGEDEE